VINLEKKHLELVSSILKKYEYSFFVFGSRITTKAKPISDLDLLYFENIPSKIINNIEEEFEESDLPFTVDLVNYHKCDTDFQKIIGKNYICLQKSTNDQNKKGC
jgi:predicted nucleotidyltransferase